MGCWMGCWMLCVDLKCTLMYNTPTTHCTHRFCFFFVCPFFLLGVKKPVDQWHLDSVPYVMVLLLSDSTDMVGGELQVARMSSPKKALNAIMSDTLDPTKIDVAQYPGAGYCIFMQGSRIAHGVTGVTFAREPRLTLVNSYQSLRPFVPACTKYRTFKVQDPDDAHPGEIGRHYAWRAAGKLDYLLKSGLNIGHFHKNKILNLLGEVADEIQQARDLITGKSEDISPYKVLPQETTGHTSKL